MARKQVGAAPSADTDAATKKYVDSLRTSKDHFWTPGVGWGSYTLLVGGVNNFHSTNDAAATPPPDYPDDHVYWYAHPLMPVP